jgi:hypothetical protein
MRLLITRPVLVRLARLSLLLCCLFLFACASAPERADQGLLRPAACLPSFPDRDGWYGGDGAYSIPLDDGRVLWLFGDTFVSDQEGRQDRVGMEVLLGTTVALSTCSGPAGFDIRYFLKKRAGKFVSFFGENEWLWPQDPFMADRTLYVPLMAVRSDPKLDGPFKFAVSGHRFARVRNFAGRDPGQWTVDTIDLTAGLPPGIKAFATTSVVHQGFVYFYPLYSETRGGVSVLGNILARIPLSGLDDPARAIAYLDRDGQWVKEPSPGMVKVVIGAAVSEMSVRYHADIGKWIAVYLSLANNGDRMLYQKADALEGPWSEPRPLIASIPEVNRLSPRYDENNFCYAGKEHPAFARDRKLVVTYVCNSFEDGEKPTSFIRRNLFLYRPVVETPGY